MYDSRCLINSHIFSFPLSLENHSALRDCTQGEQACGLQTRGRFVASSIFPLFIVGCFFPCITTSREFSPVEYSWRFLTWPRNDSVSCPSLSLDVSACWAWLRSWLHGRPPDFISQCIRQPVSPWWGGPRSSLLPHVAFGTLGCCLLSLIYEGCRLKGRFFPETFLSLSWICMLGHFDTFLNRWKNSTVENSTRDWRQKVSKWWCMQSVLQRDNESACEKQGSCRNQPTGRVRSRKVWRSQRHSDVCPGGGKVELAFHHSVLQEGYGCGPGVCLFVYITYMYTCVYISMKYASFLT